MLQRMVGMVTAIPSLKGGAYPFCAAGLTAVPGMCQAPEIARQ
jgi:hypothetical protein